MLQKGGCIVTSTWKIGQTDMNTHRHLCPAQIEGSVQCRLRPTRGNDCSFDTVDHGQQHSQVLVVEARHNVGSTKLGGELISHGAEQTLGVFVAVDSLDLSESGNLDDEHAETEHPPLGGHLV